MGDAAKELIRGKFIALQENLKKQKKKPLQINISLKVLEKEQKKTKVSRRNDIIKISVELKKIDNEKTVGKNNARKS